MKNILYERERMFDYIKYSLDVLLSVILCNLIDHNFILLYIHLIS